jgi:hypothetical protein
MTAEQFAYWLQGYAELNDGPPTAEQWQAIRDHLELVFNKVTPPTGPVKWGGVGFPPGYPMASGTVLVSGDGETRLVC